MPYTRSSATYSGVNLWRDAPTPRPSRSVLVVVVSTSSPPTNRRYSATTTAPSSTSMDHTSLSSSLVEGSDVSCSLRVFHVATTASMNDMTARGEWERERSVGGRNASAPVAWRSEAVPRPPSPPRARVRIERHGDRTLNSRPRAENSCGVDAQVRRLCGGARFDPPCPGIIL